MITGSTQLHGSYAPVGWPANDTDGDGLANFRRGYLLVLGISLFIQLAFFRDTPDNWTATLLAGASSYIGIVYALDGRRFRFQPISALILMFFTLTATSGAVIVKTIEWTPLVERLLVPKLTFSVLLCSQLTLIAADALYVRSRWLQGARLALSSRVFTRLGLMTWPTDTQLWALGVLGCVSLVLTGTDFESAASFGAANAGQKVLRAFQFFKFAPFLIPFRGALSGLPVRSSRNYLPIAAYFVLLVIVSFATNSRSTFADAIPTIGVCMLIAASFGHLRLSEVSKPKLIFWAVVAVLGALLLSRVALAMVVVRDYRYNLDAASLMKMTLEALTNNEWLEAAKAKMDSGVNIGNYSEDYVNSRFFARFLLTKFHDNIFYYFSLFGDDHIAAYREFLSQRFAANFPEPLLKLFGISINKEDLIISNGDYIVYMIDGWGLGGFKTGSMIAEIWGVFGWRFPIVLFFSAVPLYLFYDALCGTSQVGRRVLSPLILLLIWNLCGTTAGFGLGAESITALLGGIIRGIPQNVVIYLIAIYAVRKLLPGRQ